MIPLGVGRVIWAVYPGKRGEGKRRPMVVLTSRNDIVRTGRAFVVICSTSFDLPIKPDEVLLPSQVDARCVTKLPSPTVAVCNWTDIVHVAGLSVQDVGGLVPTDLVKIICAKIGKPFQSDRG